jgi:hypothetical protein
MGASNTNAIIARMDAGSVARTAYVAGLARGYLGAGGTSDWFLPSKDELNAMCNYSRNPDAPAAATDTCSGTQNVTFAAGDFGFVTSWYWSSSQTDFQTTRTQWFFNGFQQTSDGKLSSRRVRPVRAF